MKKLCLVLAIVLSLVFSVISSAKEIGAVTENAVFPEYSYDADTSLLEISLNYRGEGISAIGITLCYDTDALDYTSYSRGDGFSGFTLRATLENCGRVNILSYSPTEHGEGELIRLCFKVKDISLADGMLISPEPLTDIPCAKIENGEVRPIALEFLCARFCSFDPLSDLELCGISRDGELLLVSDSGIEDCIIDMTVVDLSGKVSRSESYQKCKKIRFEGRDVSYLTVSVGDITSPYTAVIINAHAKYNGEIRYARRVYLFREGNFIG